MTYGNSTVSTEALALISAAGISTIHLYRTVANDIGPLLGYISPSASDISGLIYVDRMIAENKRKTLQTIAVAIQQ